MEAVRRALKHWSGPLLALVVLACALVLASPPAARAEGTLISAPGRQYVAYDEVRGVLYITSGDSVLRYDVANRRFMTPMVLGGWPNGIDISADGKTVAVSNKQMLPSGPFIDLLDTASGSAHRVLFSQHNVETMGTVQVACMADGKVLVNGDYLRLYDPSNGVSTIIGQQQAFSWARLVASGDRRTVAISNGGVYPLATGVYRLGSATVDWNSGDPTVLYGGTVDYFKLLSANRDGAQFALDTRNSRGLRIFDAAFSVIKILPQARVHAYSPSVDVLYSAQSDGTSIVAYDTRTFAPTATYDFEQSFGDYADIWPDQILVSRDGKYIFANVAGGIRCVQLRPQIGGTVHSTYRGAPIEGASVEVWRSHGSDWVLEASRATGRDGGWSYAVDSTAAVKLRVSDPTGAHAAAWIGGTDLASASSVVPVPGSAVSRDATLTLVQTSSIGGVVRTGKDGRPLGGVTVTLYHDLAGLPVIGSTTTGPDGSFDFDGLGLSRYRLGFADATGAHTAAFFDSAATLDKTSSIAILTPGALTADQTLQFIPFQLTGTVRSGFLAVAVPGARSGCGAADPAASTRSSRRSPQTLRAPGRSRPATRPPSG